MKKRNRRVKKERSKGKRQNQANARKVRYLPRVTVAWGRAASEYRPGLFTKRYFAEHGEACCADIYYALSQDIERLNEERTQIGEEPLRRPNYSSFARYFHWFKLLGLIQPTGRSEPAISSFLKKKQFYRLTSKGESEEQTWLDPVRAAHPEFG